MQYRALRVVELKIVEGPIFFDADTDDDAIEQAKRMLRAPGVLQVWEGSRFIINLRDGDLVSPA
jgi:hypothetical protein